MKDNFWRRYNGVIIPWEPPHVNFELSQRQVVEDISSNHALLARWTTNFDSKIASPFWYIINDQVVKFQDYSRNTKSKIKRGFKKLNVKIIDKTDLLKDGYSVYIKAIKRYSVVLNKKSYSDFKNEIENLDSSWEIWGVYCNLNNQLVAYSLNRNSDDYCDYSTIKFDPLFLKDYSSYVLYYSMNKYYLEEKKIKYVSNGTRSISHQTNIHDFLIEKFMFRKAYCKIELVYKRKINILIKFLYPYRLIFSLIPINLFRKIYIILFQEEIKRKCQKVYKN